MNFVRIIKEIDELIYEFATWFFLVPKTLFKVLFSPKWIYSYVSDEFEKPAEERFNEYLSPALFWVIAGVLPYYFVAETLISTMSDKSVLEKFHLINIESKLFSLVVLFVSFPLASGFGINLFKQKSKTTKNSLRKIFYIQCYSFTPIQLLYVPIFLSMSGEIDSSQAASYIAVVIGLYSWWFIFSQLIIIREELKVGWLKAAGIGIVVYMITFFILILSELLILFLNWKILFR
jgi:hypothetical protein